MDVTKPATANEGLHTRIERERKAACKEAVLLKVYRNYARGKQSGTLTTAQQRILLGVVGRRFCHNVCKAVLKASSARLQLARYEVADTTVESFLKDFWTLAGLAALANQVHFATLRDGNHAVSLSWENEAQRVRLTRERWWDGKTGIFIAYDDADQPEYAVKEWQATEGLRRVVWFADRIERYVASGEGWRHYTPQGEDSWQSEWLAEDGTPLGLPVVHFRNVSVPNDASSDTDADSNYGLSDLDGGVIGLQDEINDIQRDITSAARYTGYQMLYATGVAKTVDDAGNNVPLRVEPGAVFQSESEGAKYGTLPAGDLSQLVLALTTKLKTVAQVTDTPLHTITGGDWPSGEALLQADQPLVSKVESLGEVFGPAWSSLAHKATMLANVFGNAGLNTDVMISTLFRPAEKRDQLTLSKIATALAPFVSEQEVLRILGYSPEKQKTILDERAQESQSQVQRVLDKQAAIMQGGVTSGDAVPPVPGQGGQ